MRCTIDHEVQRPSGEVSHGRLPLQSKPCIIRTEPRTSDGIDTLRRLPVKILFATPYLPVPPDFGGARRIFELIRGAQRAHDVHTLCLARSGAETTSAESSIGPITAVRVPLTARDATTQQRRALQVRSLLSAHSAQRLLYVDEDYQQVLDRLSSEVDLVQFEFSQMGGYRLSPGTPAVLDIHNVEHDLIKQMASSGSLPRRLFSILEYWKFRREEIAAWRRATCCIATSAADARVVEQATGRAVPVIPNGVDLVFFKGAGEIEPGLIVFTGAMRYRPNVDAVRYFVDEILPLVRREIPHVRFAIVGADPTADVLALQQPPDVTVTGTVADVRPWLGRAEVVVAPLRQGGGTRLKILEAFASRRPVVSTTVGAAGIDVMHERDLLLADAPDAFAHCVIRALSDRELRTRLAENGFHLVQDRYQWSAICDELNELHERLIRRPVGAAGG